MKKLRVLQLGPYPPPRGGVQANMLLIQAELIRRGHVSEILAITRSEAKGNETNVHHPESVLDFIRMLRNSNHDVLHLHIGGNVRFRVKLMMLACTILSGGKRIMTFHSGGFARSVEGQNATGKSLLGYIFRRFDQIITVNSMMLGMFEKYGVEAEKTRLIYPYSLKRSDPDVAIPAALEEFIERHQKLLISVGLLETDYDLELQINAMERVLKSQPATGLIIVGSGSLKAGLEGLIASKVYADNVLLAGDTDHEVVLRLIERADVFLRTTVFDGDAISIHESLFLGTPVIATDNGMRPEGVNLIPVGGEEELANAILDSLSHARSAPESKSDGAENITAVVDLYENLCSEKITEKTGI